MCGIAGFIGQGDRKILELMTDKLKHRGPDQKGLFVNKRAHLGHRRLSIIDLSSGKQPIFNENRKIAVVFNGEIYNFLELKKELQDQGHQFSTNTDTEVLVHLYEEEGERFLEKLNGMFALALWDEDQKKLILARDRLGQKPLYYSFQNNTLIFASELKSLIVHPLIKREIDFFSLAKYLNYEYVPAPLTIFKDIYKLEPAKYLVFKNNKIERNSYWQINFSSQFEIEKSETFDGLILEALNNHLDRAVNIRLMADVPLGVWLSGGIDSTTIAYYAQKNSKKPIKTFSIGFEESSFDESSYARQAASFLGTEHYEQILEPKDCLNLIPEIAGFLDEPLADASIVPTYLLAKFTRQKVKVALGGDGGDELFMGYYTFQAHKLAKLYQKLPRSLRQRVIEPTVNRLPVSMANFSLDFKLKKFVSGFDCAPEIRDQIWLGSFNPEQLPNLFSPEIKFANQADDIFENIFTCQNQLTNECLENRLIYLYQTNYLQDDILTKTDRASMANSLEVRAPLLDFELVDFVNSLPVRYKMKGLKTKYILKKLMANKLPKEIVERTKKGFGMPVAHWLRGPLKDFSQNLLNFAKIEREGIFNPVFVQNIFNEHQSGKKDHRKLLWTLLIFEIWQEKWLS